MAKSDFGCGRPECGASTGICGSATFGTGELDNNGYWEHPCEKCEKAWKEYSMKIPFFTSPICELYFVEGRYRMGILSGDNSIRKENFYDLIDKNHETIYCYKKDYWGELKDGRKYVVEYFNTPQEDTKEIKLKIYKAKFSGSVWWKLEDNDWKLFFPIIENGLFDSLSQNMRSLSVKEVSAYYRIREI